METRHAGNVSTMIQQIDVEALRECIHNMRINTTFTKCEEGTSIHKAIATLSSDTCNAMDESQWVKLLEMINILVPVCDIDATDKLIRTPLHNLLRVAYPVQINEQYLDVVTRLITPQSLSAKDCEHNTPLHVAIHAARWGAVELLLDHHADVNVRDCQGRTALSAAMFVNSLPRHIGQKLTSVPTRLLPKLTSKENINTTDLYRTPEPDDGHFTPLHHALKSDCIKWDNVETLLMLGADRNCCGGNDTSITPIEVYLQGPLGLCDVKDEETMMLLIPSKLPNFWEVLVGVLLFSQDEYLPSMDKEWKEKNIYLISCVLMNFPTWNVHSFQYKWDSSFSMALGRIEINNEQIFAWTSIPIVIAWAVLKAMVCAGCTIEELPDNLTEYAKDYRDPYDGRFTKHVRAVAPLIDGLCFAHKKKKKIHTLYELTCNAVRKYTPVKIRRCFVEMGLPPKVVNDVSLVNFAQEIFNDMRL